MPCKTDVGMVFLDDVIEDLLWLLITVVWSLLFALVTDTAAKTKAKRKAIQATRSNVVTVVSLKKDAVATSHAPEAFN